MADTAKKITKTEDRKTPKEDPRLSGFYRRNPFLLCIIGRDTLHTHRVASGPDDELAHPLYDVRAHDNATAEDIDGAMAVGDDPDIIPVVRVRFPVRLLRPEYVKMLGKFGVVVPKKPDETMELECVDDGRHRGIAYREAWLIAERSGRVPCEVKVELKKGLSASRMLALRIAKNCLRRDDTTLHKAELMRDYCLIRADEEYETALAEWQEKGEKGEAPKRRDVKEFYAEAAGYFGVNIVSIRQWAELLSRHPAVIQAVRDEVISASTAIESFRSVPYEDQPAKLAECIAKGVTQHDEVKALVRKNSVPANGDGGGTTPPVEKPTDRKGETGGDFGGAVEPETKPNKPASPSGGSKKGADGGGSKGGTGDKSGAAEGRGTGETLSATTVTFKPAKDTLRALCEAFHAGRLKDTGLSESFIHGIEFALARSVDEPGLRDALVELKMITG